MAIREKTQTWLETVGVISADVKYLLGCYDVEAALKEGSAYAVLESLRKNLTRVNSGAEALRRLNDPSERSLFVLFINGVEVTAPAPKIGQFTDSSNIFFTRHDGGLTLFATGADGKSKQTVISNTHINFTRILDALRERRFADLNTLINITETINNAGMSTSSELAGRRVFVKNGKIYYNRADDSIEQLHGTLVERILEALQKGKTKFADALLMFLDNIQRNPLKDIRAELYEFLTSGKTPITSDGCFLAYKRVSMNFRDIYSNTMDNSPGKVVRMDPEKVNRDRNQTCSTGLHFASRGYLSHYADVNSSKTVVLKVNPKDVYAIPTDYNFQKGRASEYFVVGVFTGNTNFEDAFLDSFIDDDNKEQVAPKVKFHGSLRPSLEQIGESYLIVTAGRVNVVKSGDGYLVVRKNDDKKNPGWFDVYGKKHTDAEVKSMSFETKSIRQAVKETVAALEEIVAKRLAEQKAKEIV